MDGTALFFYEKETHAMKRISTLLAAGLCLLSLAFLASGCSKQAPQAVQRQEVLIGTNLSLTGPGEAYCRSTEQGVGAGQGYTE